MSKPSSTGRTPWDLLSEILHTRLIYAVLLLILLISVVIHWVAKPDTDVSTFWGFNKYQKQEAVATVEPYASHPAELEDYVLPQEAMTFRPSYSERPASPLTYVILDRAINVSCDDNFVTFDGAQVKEISVAGRTDEGVPLVTGRHVRSGAIRVKVNSDISHIELKYKGNNFYVTVYRTGEVEGCLSVSSLKQSTLELIPYQKLPTLYESLVKP